MVRRGVAEGVESRARAGTSDGVRSGLRFGLGSGVVGVEHGIPDGLEGEELLALFGRPSKEGPVERGGGGGGTARVGVHFETLWISH